MPGVHADMYFGRSKALMQTPEQQWQTVPPDSFLSQSDIWSPGWKSKVKASWTPHCQNSLQAKLPVLLNTKLTLTKQLESHLRVNPNVTATVWFPVRRTLLLKGVYEKCLTEIQFKNNFKYNCSECTLFELSNTWKHKNPALKNEEWAAHN